MAVEFLGPDGFLPSPQKDCGDAEASVVMDVNARGFRDLFLPVG
jgi:hypothetical protein